MVTFVGAQAHFKDAIYALVELEYDILGAYKLALELLETSANKTAIQSFIEDHEQNIQMIKTFYANTKFKLPEFGDILKEMLAKIKVKIGSIVGSDVYILKALLEGENDLKQGYQMILQHADKPFTLNVLLLQAFDNIKQHNDWLSNATQ